MIKGLPDRGLKSAAELAAHKPHGTRIKYLAGCRCDDCRQANCAYAKERARAIRAGEWNGFVSAAKARRHIHKLSALGVGKRSIATCTDIATSIIDGIKNGTRKKIRARTEKLILAVTKDMLPQSALIDAAPTWVLINQLLAEGYTKSELALSLGYKSPALQIKKNMVTTRIAEAVKRLHRNLHCKRDPLKARGSIETSTGGVMTVKKRQGATVISHRMAA